MQSGRCYLPLQCKGVKYLFQETYGEDPYLSGIYAKEFVHGIKGDHPRYLRANTICKHFDAYGGPENLPSSRLSFDAQVSLTFNPFPNKPLFSRICSTSLLKTL